ncbi:MAG: RIO1 family regulatory kinase/ATPase domain-containing protein [Acidimicrobiales bacterium]
MSVPDWLIAEPDAYEEYDLGPFKSGKEAEVFLVERVLGTRSCLLAHKRYRPRAVKTKGELQALGFQRSASFVNDHAYRAGRRIPDSRAQRAADTKTAFGRRVLATTWPAEEVAMLTRLWAAGVHVPYPVAATHDGVLMQYLGDRGGAAPPIARAHLARDEALVAAEQVVEDLHRMVAAGIVHADLSAYNILWWEQRAWIIDVPQAVDLTVNVHALDFLIRDLRNIGTWFARQGVFFDADEVFADLLTSAFG